MKILIVTHPLANNYGGLLQAYALQKTLEGLGHEPWVLNVSHESKRTRTLRFFRNVGYTILGRFYVTEKDKQELSRNMTYFAQTYIKPQTPILKTKKVIKTYVKQQKFDAVIVGSDQVWRPKYLKNIDHYFLDFTKGLELKRFSYAASFGVDYWEYSQEQTMRCKELLANFDAVSVREDSGISLCKQYFGRDAVQVLDPTLLLEKEYYIDLVRKELESEIRGSLFCYILDNSDKTRNMTDKVSEDTGYQPYYCMPEEVAYSKMTESNKCKFLYPPVTQWIKSIMDAQLVLTDSFHGCVFSIIFNKPFWVIINTDRGASRFASLLKLFGLENRIVNMNDKSNINWAERIDWEKVNNIRNVWKQKSLAFLQANL